MWDVVSGKWAMSADELQLAHRPSADTWTDGADYDRQPGAHVAWSGAARLRSSRQGEGAAQSQAFHVTRATAETIFADFSHDPAQRHLGRYERRIE